MKEKVYFSPDLLIKKLYQEKGMKPNSIPENVFDEASYNELFRSYAEFLCTGIDSEQQRRSYPKETDFNDVIEWVKADEACSMVLHVYIGNFERRIRSFVINKYCNKIKEIGDKRCFDNSIASELLAEQNRLGFRSLNDYLNITFSRQDPNDHRPPVIVGPTEAQNKADEVMRNSIKDFGDCFGPNKDPRTELEYHYKTNYGYIPAFVGMCDLSFSTSTLLFALLPYEDQKIFWNKYKRNTRRFDNERDFAAQQRKLRQLVNFRNAINHYEPLFPKIIGRKHQEIPSICSMFSSLKANNKLSIASYKCSIEAPVLPPNRNPSVTQKYNDLLSIIYSIFDDATR